MAHKVISLKYRPQNFDELTGQRHVVLALKGAIKSKAIGHAFLFAGPRGVGKTTTARVFAKSVNCIEGPTVTPCQKCPSCLEITASRSIDVVEIDGASNRGINEIRELREGVRYAPLHCRYKIYIIDEVHALTPDAFNALLKTLEEPPVNVIFILATTNPVKVPATILSRCQRFTFKRLTLAELSHRLGAVAERENIKIDPDALHYLAVRADGSVRDGESILEQLASFVSGSIARDDILKLIGFMSADFYGRLFEQVLSGDLAAVLTSMNRGIEEGGDPLEIYRGLVGFLRNILLHKAGLKDDFLEMSPDELELLEKYAVSKEELTDIIDHCLKSEEVIRRSINPRIAIELLLSQLTLKTGSVEKNPGKDRGTAEPSAKSRGEARAVKPGDLKESLMAALAVKSPKLAGMLHKTAVSRDGKTVSIKTDAEFTVKELQKHQRTLIEMIKKVTGEEVELTIKRGDAVKKDIDTMTQTLKTMFDGEEVR